MNILKWAGLHDIPSPAALNVISVVRFGSLETGQGTRSAAIFSDNEVIVR